jgi:hypothetical protein
MNNITIDTDAQLKDIITAVSEDYPQTIMGHFAPLPNLAIRWVRWGCSAEIELKVSDYLVGAPEGVVEDLVRSTLDSIITRERPEYTDRVKDFLLSDEFRSAHLEDFALRNGCYVATTLGGNDLMARAQALVDMGLIPLDDMPAVLWSMNPKHKASALFRVLFIDDRLAMDGCEEVTELLIWQGYLLFCEGRDAFAQGSAMTPLTQEELERYPHFQKAMEQLETLGIDLL